MIEPDALIDSNIFVYAWVSQEKEKHDIALRLFERFEAGKLSMRFQSKT